LGKASWAVAWDDAVEGEAALEGAEAIWDDVEGDEAAWGGEVGAEALDDAEGGEAGGAEVCLAGDQGRDVGGALAGVHVQDVYDVHAQDVCGGVHDDACVCDGSSKAPPPPTPQPTPFASIACNTACLASPHKSPPWIYRTPYLQRHPLDHSMKVECKTSWENEEKVLA
jgi:hypothetical protein